MSEKVTDGYRWLQMKCNRINLYTASSCKQGYRSYRRIPFLYIFELIHKHISRKTKNMNIRKIYKYRGFFCNQV